MKKISSLKSKKPVVKEEQKISSFFNKLRRKESSENSSNSSTEPKQVPGTSSNIREATKTNERDIEDCVIVSVHKENTIIKKSTKSKSNTQKKTTKNIPKEQDDIDSSDSDFVSSKKKMSNNLLNNFKTKHKYLYEKSKMEEHNMKANKANEKSSTGKIESKSNQKTKSGRIDVSTMNNKENSNLSESDSSILEVELSDIKLPKEKNEPYNPLFMNTPDKTYLQKDEILTDITHVENLPDSHNALDVLYTNIKFQKSQRKTSPVHSTPCEKSKKRRFSKVNSPEIIPPTPEIQRFRTKSKTKLFTDKKLGKINDDQPVEISDNIPDMIIEFPLIKRQKISRESQNKQVVNLSEITSDEFEQIHSISLRKAHTKNTPEKKLSDDNSSSHHFKSLKNPKKSDDLSNKKTPPKKSDDLSSLRKAQTENTPEKKSSKVLSDDNSSSHHFKSLKNQKKSDDLSNKKTPPKKSDDLSFLRKAQTENTPEKKSSKVLSDDNSSSHYFKSLKNPKKSDDLSNKKTPPKNSDDLSNKKTPPKNSDDLSNKQTPKSAKKGGTSTFDVTIIKHISPSKNSPHKGKITYVSPAKVSSTRRSLFNPKSPIKDISLEVKTRENVIDDCNTNPSKCNRSILTTNLNFENDTEMYPKKQNLQSCLPLSTDQVTREDTKIKKSTQSNELLDYFNNLPSSCEEKQCMELDQSNFIVTKKIRKEENHDMLMNDLDFDDSWNEDFDDICLDILDLTTWQYCNVLEVIPDLYQIIIRLQSIETNKQAKCALQGIWQSSRLKSGDTVNIVAIKDTGSVPFVVTNNDGFLVFEPDHLISPTTIVGSHFCMRKGILSDRFRGFDSENKVMIVGTIVHEILQKVLKRKVYDAPFIEKMLFDIISSKSVIKSSYSSQVPIEEMKAEILPFIPKILEFVKKYVQCDEKPTQKMKNAKKAVQPGEWQGSIQSIEDIEENIWCPKLGVKGKVDVTIKTHPFGAILPLELKTGRASLSLEHKGQLILYSMMMTEIGYNVTSGLLLYLREGSTREVKASHREKRDLTMLRNDIVYYLQQESNILAKNNRDRQLDNQIETDGSSASSISATSESNRLLQLTAPELPQPISHHSACSKCPYNMICTAFLSRDTTYKLSNNQPLKKLSEELLSKLQPAHIDYFVHWTSLLTLESNHKPPAKELKHIWRLPPHQRERRGKSICFLQLSQLIVDEGDSYLHEFARSTKQEVKDIIEKEGLKSDFLASGLSVGNYVIVSTDSRVATAAGFITKLSETEITVSLERNLNNMYGNKTFHIDTYESQSIMTFNMTSLAALLESTNRATRLRELIVDKKPSIITGKLSKSIMVVGGHILRRLNKIQQRAVLKALTIEDYLLIKGMPGTGKTATIVALVQLLVELKKSVLITSHTHSAVDNVCLRLLDCGVDVLRLGSESRVHPRLKHRTEAALTAHCNSVDDLEKVYNSACVVAVTCLAAGHPMLSRRMLDVCVVDESTQVLQCSVIKALLSTSTFVLIGDPDQLPPVVRNPQAVRRGMNESLFERLDNPLSTITLTLQYRMNKTITKLANDVTYKGQLLCADDSIGYATLRLPKLERLQSVFDQEPWVLEALDIKIQNSVIALDTGPTYNNNDASFSNNDDKLLSELQVPAQNVNEDEERICSNHCEAAIIVTIVEALKQAGVKLTDIGIIAPYRAQVNLLSKVISKLCEAHSDENVEVNTVDQYQGRDKDVIIYSCTKSRDPAKRKTNTEFEILEDKRRLTVAITRAKHKLIIIADFATLKDYSPFNKLLNSLKLTQKLRVQNGTNGFEWCKVMKRLNELL